MAPKGQEKPAILDPNGAYRDVSAYIDDVAGVDLGDETIAKLKALDLARLQELDANQRIGACVANVGKFICIGLNYADHAAESGLDVPSEPVMFMKLLLPLLDPMMKSKSRAIHQRPIGKLNWVSSLVATQNM